MTPTDGGTRRKFLQKASTATVLVGTSFGAVSYARIAGANERFVLGLIGCGGRGQALMKPFAQQRAVFNAVCAAGPCKSSGSGAELPISNAA